MHWALSKLLKEGEEEEEEKEGHEEQPEGDTSTAASTAAAHAAVMDAVSEAVDLCEQVWVWAGGMCFTDVATLRISRQFAWQRGQRNRVRRCWLGCRRVKCCFACTKALFK